MTSRYGLAFVSCFLRAGVGLFWGDREMSVSEDAYLVLVGEALLPTERVTCVLSAEITHRKPVWDEPVSGGVPRRALGR